MVSDLALRTVPAGYVQGFVCSLKTCDVKIWGYVKYQPSLPGNALFLCIFLLIGAIHLYLGIRYRTTAVAFCVILGCMLEVIGYLGRILLHNDPFYQPYFLIYLIELTIAPVFFAAAIYLCLGRIVVVYGEEISRIKPRYYTWIFLTCDFVSLVVQAVGGGIAASVPLTHQVAIANGTHIMVAGLAFQVANLVGFLIMMAEFLWFRVRKNRGNLSSLHADIYNRKQFKLFIPALVLATCFIFVRSVFRVIELQEGFSGHLANNQTLFMVLDGVMVIFACLTLTVAYPGWAFGKEGWKASSYPFVAVDPVVERKRLERQRQEMSGDSSTPKRWLQSMK